GGGWGVGAGCRAGPGAGVGPPRPPARPPIDLAADDRPEPPPVSPAIVPPMRVPVPAIAPEPAPTAPDWKPLAQRWLVSLWLAGVCLLSLRLLLGAAGLWRLRRGLEPLPAALAERAAQLADRLGLRRLPRIAVSARVAEAMALGFV